MSATVTPEQIKHEQEKFYHGVNLALFMAVVTGIELVIIFIPMSAWIIMFWVVLLSVVKFAGVIAWFMHLIYDRPLLTMIFGSGLVLGGGTVVALLMLFSQDRITIHPDLEAADPIPPPHEAGGGHH